jgi:hypothetical protein
VTSQHTNVQMKRTRERLAHEKHLKFVTQTEGMPACATQPSPTVRPEYPADTVAS